MDTEFEFSETLDLFDKDPQLDVEDPAEIWPELDLQTVSDIEKNFEMHVAEDKSSENSFCRKMQCLPIENRQTLQSNSAKRRLVTNSFPLRKKGRGFLCPCKVHRAGMHTAVAQKAIPDPKTMSNQTSAAKKCRKTSQTLWSHSSTMDKSVYVCPICSDQLRVRTAPLRHKGNDTVNVFVCGKEHMFMKCSNNDQHTDLLECKKNHQGKIVHICKRCPPKKQKRVLCNYCLASFESYTGASSFHPIENCPYYLKKNPHVIKQSHLRQLKSLITAGVIRQLRHQLYTSMRRTILLELSMGDAGR